MQEAWLSDGTGRSCPGTSPFLMPPARTSRAPGDGDPAQGEVASRWWRPLIPQTPQEQAKERGCAAADSYPAASLVALSFASE